MQFTFLVEVEVERAEGKFASRDELEQQLLEALESADPSSLTGDNGGEYEVTSFEVTAQDQPKKGRKTS